MVIKSYFQGCKQNQTAWEEDQVEKGRGKCNRRVKEERGQGKRIGKESEKRRKQESSLPSLQNLSEDQLGFSSLPYVGKNIKPFLPHFFRPFYSFCYFKWGRRKGRYAEGKWKGKEEE